jgi:hypothetical protein
MMDEIVKILLLHFLFEEGAYWRVKETEIDSNVTKDSKNIFLIDKILVI